MYTNVKRFIQIRCCTKKGDDAENTWGECVCACCARVICAYVCIYVCALCVCVCVRVRVVLFVRNLCVWTHPHAAPKKTIQHKYVRKRLTYICMYIFEFSYAYAYIHVDILLTPNQPRRCNTNMYERDLHIDVCLYLNFHMHMHTSILTYLSRRTKEDDAAALYTKETYKQLYINMYMNVHMYMKRYKLIYLTRRIK